jgi:uncharacterized protein (DUF1501 family)
MTIGHPPSAIRNGFSRRDWLRLSAAGVLGGSVSGWFERLALHAAEENTKPAKACILMWLDGGPSHIDTFDPKPEAAAAVRGELKAIATAVPGIQVGEKFPKLAALMKHAAIVRGMTTDVPDHARARLYVHTGYKPTAGGPRHPLLGSIVAAELGQADSPMPNFVACGAPRMTVGSTFLDDAGYLGPRHAPLVVANLQRGVENLKALTDAVDFQQRIAVLDDLEQAFLRSRPVEPAQAHRTAYQRAVALMRSDKTAAFDLTREPAAVHEAYGRSDFGQGCLLARRLVEVGIPFIEVYCRDWDSHEGKLAQELASTTMPAVDQAIGALAGDLKARGLLDRTLLLCLGEFGRTPRINANGGRDHFPAAWSALMLGGGLRGGQVIGRTDAEGATVAARPVSVVDFMATVCQVLGINHRKRLATPGGRKLAIVDLQTQENPRLLTELF